LCPDQHQQHQRQQGQQQHLQLCQQQQGQEQQQGSQQQGQEHLHQLKQQHQQKCQQQQRQQQEQQQQQGREEDALLLMPTLISSSLYPRPPSLHTLQALLSRRAQVEVSHQVPRPPQALNLQQLPQQQPQQQDAQLLEQYQQTTSNTGVANRLDQTANATTDWVALAGLKSVLKPRLQVLGRQELADRGLLQPLQLGQARGGGRQVGRIDKSLLSQQQQNQEQQRMQQQQQEQEEQQQQQEQQGQGRQIKQQQQQQQQQGQGHDQPLFNSLVRNHQDIEVVALAHETLVLLPPRSSFIVGDLLNKRTLASLIPPDTSLGMCTHCR